MECGRSVWFCRPKRDPRTAANVGAKEESIIISSSAKGWVGAGVDRWVVHEGAAAGDNGAPRAPGSGAAAPFRRRSLGQAFPSCGSPAGLGFLTIRTQIFFLLLDTARATALGSTRCVAKASSQRPYTTFTISGSR